MEVFFISIHTDSSDTFISFLKNEDMRVLVLYLLGLFCSQHVFADTNNDNGKTAVLEFIGGSTAIVMYNTYLCIGLTADLYSGGVYDAEFTQVILNEQLQSITAVQGQLKRVQDSGYFITVGDKNYMSAFSDVLTKLSNQATALYDYTLSGESADLEYYDSIRAELWEDISSLLGIK
jgi:hypothetical protein